jgi:hypothetical protein
MAVSDLVLRARKRAWHARQRAMGRPRTPAKRDPPAPVERVPEERQSAEKVRVAKQAAPALEQLGWIASRRDKRPVDGRGRPVPWYTYPAISFLEERVAPEMRVLEFGSGLSTLWWARRVAHVTSIEHDPEWVAELESQLPANAELLVRPDDVDGKYARAGEAGSHAPYDIIVIDGRDRMNCAILSLDLLAPEGVILWDNSERRDGRLGRSALEERGFRHLKFVGMGPKLARVWETTVYYRPGNCLGI